MTNLVCVEMARFDLQSGHSTAELVAASEKLQSEFLLQCPGFLQRELVHLGDLSYMDLVHWRTAQDAHAVMQQAMSSPAAMAYFALMSPGTQPPLHGTSLATYR